MLTKRACLILVSASLMAIAFSAIGANEASAEHSESFHVRMRVDDKTFDQRIPSPVIDAYDLSPDGSRLALLVLSGDPLQAPVPSWIVVVSAIDASILKLVRFGTRAQWVQGYASQISFMADGKLLAVEDQERDVSVFDSTTLSKIRTIDPDSGSRFVVPASIVVAGNGVMAAISFGTGDAVTNYLDKMAVHTMIVDVSNGRQVASWDADDTPLSISPDANFVAVSDHSLDGPVMYVDILKGKSGEKVGTLLGGQLPVKNHLQKGYIARLIARFINDDEAVLTGDGSKDQLGRDLVEGMKIVSAMDGHVIQEITPKHFGPTGNIAVSSGQTTFAAISRYIPSTYLTHDSRIPYDFKPELLILSKQHIFRLEDRLPLPALLALRTPILMDTARLRISADGSVISVAENYGVTVLASK